MILIDCTYLNSPGGKKILKVFLDKLLINKPKNLSFIIDNRVDKELINQLKNSHYKLIRNSEFKRRSYYKSIKNKIKKCICLASVPPPIKLECEVIIYFHNDLIIKPNLSLSLLNTISFLLKKTYIKMINSKKYRWAVQTNLMRKKLSEALFIKNEMISVFPIFRDFLEKKSFKKTPNSFLYVCSSSPHKNLKRLINAFNRIKNIKSKRILLHLTISDNEYFNHNILSKNKNSNLTIINHGILNESSLNRIYSDSKYLIYPSIIESFGLPLIESIEFNCKIIASDLDYVKEIVKPSITFNPFSILSISNSIDFAIENNDIKESKIIINNKIDKFTELILS